MHFLSLFVVFSLEIIIKHDRYSHRMINENEPYNMIQNNHCDMELLKHNLQMMLSGISRAK